MKHLTKYKLFESSSTTDIISDIKDMLVEIEDCGGINANCKEFKPFNYHKTRAAGKEVLDSEIRVWIKPPESGDEDEDNMNVFGTNDTVIEVFKRIIEYMKSRGWTEYGLEHDDGIQNREMNLDEIDRMEIWEGESLGIWFRKLDKNSPDTLQIPQGWNQKDERLVKDFKFDTFREAQSFLNKVADLAESQNHHPQIEWTYNVVELSLSTHDAGDIVTNKDIKLAVAINGII